MAADSVQASSGVSLARVDPGQTGEGVKTENAEKKSPAEKPLYSKKPSEKPLGTRQDSSTTDLMRQMMAMVVVILLLGVVGWFVFKKFLPRLKGSTGLKERSIRVLETTYISPRQPIYLLQVGQKKLLITGGKEGLRLLADVTGEVSEFSDVLAERQANETEAGK